MDDFRTIAPPLGGLDPDKRVNYPLGLVLGVDEFEQEHFFLEERDRQHTRAFHGYGTVCGLRVRTEGVTIVVEPGLAISPQGKIIRVLHSQCANLNDWLGVTDHLKELEKYVGSPPTASSPGTHSLHVVLCYRECETDNVPVPAPPCRSEEDYLAPSRITQTFELRLSVKAPPAEEEQAVRLFGELLRSIQINPQAGPGTALTEEDMIQLVRALKPGAPSPTSPISSPIGSPPVSGPLFLRPDEAATVLRAGFRVWTTEVRPSLLKDCKDYGGPAAEKSKCHPQEESQDGSDCVLLAKLSFTLTDGGQVAPPEKPVVDVDDADRPYLLHTRLLQEWLMGNPREGVSTEVVGSDIVASETAFNKAPNAGTSSEYSRGDHIHGTPPDPIPDHRADPKAHVLTGDLIGDIGNNKLAKIQGKDVEASAPGDEQVLTFLGGKWKPAALPPASTPPLPSASVKKETSFGLSPNAGTSSEYSRGDHIHGTPPDPIPPHRAAADAHSLGGDVTGNIGNALVGKIQNVPVVKPQIPQDNGKVLALQNGQWQAAPVASVVGDFVEHPRNLPRYGIVAAGILSPSSSRQPTYNDLKIALVGSPPVAGRLLVSFPDYKQPTRNPRTNQWSHHYIVKVLPVLKENVEISRTVAFVNFSGDGILLLVMDLGKPVEKISDVELMIEISRYPFEG